MANFPVREKPYRKNLLFIELGKNKRKIPISEGKRTLGVGDNVPFVTAKLIDL